MSTVLVKRITFHPCLPRDRASGLRGWATVDAGDWIFDNIAVRVGADGRALISFPANVTRSGRECPHVRPANATVRAEVETAVLDYVRKGGWLRE